MSSSPTIADCVFVQNLADHDFGFAPQGGGLWSSGSPVVEHCRFEHNAATWTLECAEGSSCSGP